MPRCLRSLKLSSTAADEEHDGGDQQNDHEDRDDESHGRSLAANLTSYRHLTARSRGSVSAPTLTYEGMGHGCLVSGEEQAASPYASDGGI